MRDGQLFHPFFRETFKFFLLVILMPFRKVLGQKFCFSHFGKIKKKHFLLTSAKIWTANNSWNTFPNELKFGTEVKSINIFQFKKNFFWKIAYISKNQQFSFFLKKCWRHQFLWNFFLKMKDIHNLYLYDKFELIWIKTPGIISILSFWRLKYPSFPWQRTQKYDKS